MCGIQVEKVLVDTFILSPIAEEVSVSSSGLPEHIQLDFGNATTTEAISAQKEWLLERNKLIQPARSPTLPEDANRIFTPLKLPSWAEVLRSYPNEEVALFMLRGIAQGFRIGFIPSSTSLRSAARNLEGALTHPQVVEVYLKEELSLGKVVGPLPPSLYTGCHVSRFGVIPKGHQQEKWRLIVDLSFPKGHSINNGIPKPLCSLKYISIDDAVQKILHYGKGMLLAKIDIKVPLGFYPCIHWTDICCGRCGTTHCILIPAFHLVYARHPSCSICWQTCWHGYWNKKGSRHYTT